MVSWPCLHWFITNFSPHSLWDDICDRELAAAEFDELKAAARRVRDDIERDRFAFLGEPSVISPGLKICQEVLRAAEHKQAKCKDENGKSTSRGLVKLGHIYGSIAKSVQKFVSVGDVASQIDPLHFGVPWAAIRLALLVSQRAQRS